MDFPIVELLSESASEAWVTGYFHPQGLRCIRCKASVEQARRFRQTSKSDLRVYRCKDCKGIYTVYSGTVFEGSHLPCATVVLLIRGVLKGESAASLARELGLSRTTVTKFRYLLHRGLQAQQARSALEDDEVEADECYQNAGEKK